MTIELHILDTYDAKQLSHLVVVNDVIQNQTLDTRTTHFRHLCWKTTILLGCLGK